ncbi:MAG: fibronectin type III domain-containing protein [Clostridia bacterium]|nr:fibronectin type III domain-containing protein [Clostridia bacterium]
MKRFAAFVFALVALLSAFVPELYASALSVDESYTVTDEIISLDGKTVMVIGNSMVYYGNCVISGDEKERDYGYLHQIIASGNEDATVLDYTFPGRTLEYIYENHLMGLEPDICNSVDFIVMSESTQDNPDLFSDCMQIIDLFPNAEESAFMCHPIMYEKELEGSLAGVRALRDAGVRIADWGKIVYDVYTGAVNVPFSLMKYDRCSFIKDNVGYDNGNGYVGGSKEGDDKHPNPLSGYISALTVYTALTNRSALFADYSFCNDRDINKFFYFDNFIKAHYNGDKDTNFDRIFASAPDMTGLQTLINRYNENEGRHCLAVSHGTSVSCVTGGLTDGIYCEVCNRIVVPQTVIPATGRHTVVYDAAEAPDCINEGKTSGAHCSVCEAVLIPQLTVAAKGHSFNKITLAATTDKNGAKIKRCSVCGYEETDSVISKVASVTLSETGYKYSSKSTRTPTVTVKDSKGKTLKKNTDYTVKYLQSKRTEPGIYQVQVKLRGDYSGSETVNFAIAPRKTQGLEMTKNSSSSVTLSWNKMSGATGYAVYQYSPSKKTYKKIKDLKGTSYTVKDKSSATTYYYAVRAYVETEHGKTYGNYSEVLKVTTRPKTPSVTVTAGNNTATVSWKQVTRASGYNVYMSTSKNGTYSKVGSTSGKSSTKLTVRKLTDGKKYYFKVKAYKTVSKKKVYSVYSSAKSCRVK